MTEREALLNAIDALIIAQIDNEINMQPAQPAKSADYGMGYAEGFNPQYRRPTMDETIRSPQPTVDDVYKLAAALAEANEQIRVLRAELAKHQESEFHPDWSMLDATRDSLAEHQQIIHKLNERVAAAEQASRWESDLCQQALERIKLLEDALRDADAALEAAVFLPSGCKEEFAFYASCEDARAALAAQPAKLPLTDEHIRALWIAAVDEAAPLLVSNTPMMFARAVERAHNIREK